MARNKRQDDKFSSPFATVLRNLLIERDKTQGDIANITGKTRQTVSQYCNGTSEPGYDTLVKIADYFNVSLDYLLGRTEDPDIRPCAAEELGLTQRSIDILRLAQNGVNDELLLSRMKESGFIDRYSEQLIGDGLSADEIDYLAFRYAKDLRNFVDVMISAVCYNGGILLDFGEYTSVRKQDEDVQADNMAMALSSVATMGRVRSLTNTQYIRYISNEIAKAIDHYLVERYKNGIN